MFQSPGAVLVKIGPVTIRWYGLMIAVGFLLATFAVMRKAKQWGLNPDVILNCCLTCFMCGIIGARLYFAALKWPAFAGNPLEILAIWNGGLSIHGGLIGAIIGGIIFCRLHKLPVLAVCDLLACVTPLGQAIGRWGNFFNSEAFGRPVDESFPLKLFIPIEHRPINYINNEYFHPTFLYESVWNLLLFVALYFGLADRMRKYPGMIFCIYIAGYSLGRLLIEPIRTDSIMAFGMAAPIIASAVSLGVAVIATGALVLRGPREAGAEPEAGAESAGSQST